ncbi:MULTISPECIES: hypothetical protein [Streptomyces]|uniref:Uncharacterized protein n=1 Tax=Streptomyces sp. 900129855 TaxID=3155129 RepID=A0ABV2ZRQ9_9ACTN
MNATQTAAIFTAATTATNWTNTNLGLTATVSAEGYDYTVRLPKGSGKAFIAGRDGFGGSEFLEVEATWAQTLEIVEAAMAATHI